MCDSPYPFHYLLFSHALSENAEGVYLHVRRDGSLFNIARLRAKTKVREQLIRDLLLTDDCRLFVHLVIDLQRLMNCFAVSASAFGLTISASQTEVMCCNKVSTTDENTVPPVITVKGQVLKIV